MRPSRPALRPPTGIAGLLPLVLLAGLTAACTSSAADEQPAPSRPRVAWTPYVSAESASALDRTADPSAYNLAFAVADGRDCAPVWGGTEPVDDPAVRSRIAKLRADAGVRVSFGGEAGRELALVCEDPAQLAAAYGRALRAAGTDLADFDVEGGAVRDKAANARRDEAVVDLQKKGTLGPVTYTLPVMPDGLDADALALLRGAREAGVKIAAVNIMAMSYGTSYDDDKTSMAAYAERAAIATQRQLRKALGLSPAAAWKSLHLTVMPGVNDITVETFTLDDARTLRAFAVGSGVGALSMWAAFRDRPCAAPAVRKTAQERCTGIAQREGDFARALAGV